MNSPSHKAIVIGVWFAAAAAISFSFKAILVKLAYPYGVDPITLLALRMIFSVPFFIAVGIREHGSGRHLPLTMREWLTIGGLGILSFYGASMLDFIGLQYISVGLERLILFLYPTLVALLSLLFLGKRMSRREALAQGLAYAGIALVFFHDIAASTNERAVLIGGSMVFGSALVYAIYLIAIGQMVGKIGSMRLTAYAMTWASATCILQFALTHPWSAFELPWQVYALSVGMAVFCTVLPVFMMTSAIRRIGAPRVALIGAVGPLVTIFLGFLILGEPLSLAQLAGAALVMAGVLLVSRVRVASSEAV